MKIYLVRFAKVYGIPKDESFSEKDLDEVGKEQANRTAKFFAGKDIKKIYLNRTIAGEKTTEILKKELNNDFTEETISPKKENENFERVKEIFEKIKQDKNNVLIISSSDFITSFILYVLNLSLKEKKYFGVKNCSISTIELNEKKEVIYFDINDSSHLLRFSPHYLGSQ